MAVTVEGMPCPACGNTEYQEKYLPKKLYVCAHIIRTTDYGNGRVGKVICGHCQSYCPKCDNVYDESAFGLHGDVYEHKACLTTNWSYTDYIRGKNRFKAALQAYNEGTSTMSLKEILENFGNY